jgi:hypothetical protein
VRRDAGLSEGGPHAFGHADDAIDQLLQAIVALSLGGIGEHVGEMLRPNHGRHPRRTRGMDTLVALPRAPRVLVEHLDTARSQPGR